MSRLAAVVRLDLRLQWRYGAIMAAMAAAAAWVGVLNKVPERALPVAVPLIVFLDSALLGFFFLPAMVLFEKGERTLPALMATPLRFGEYLTSKLATFAGLALASAAVVAVGGRGVRFDPLALAAGVLLLSVLSSLISLIAVARFDAITRYLVWVPLPTSPLALPLLDFFGVLHSPLFWGIPTHGALRLIGGAFGSVTTFQVTAAVVSQMAWIAALVPVARWAFQRHVFGTIGGVPRVPSGDPDPLTRGGV